MAGSTDAASVHNITDASTAHSDEMRGRMIKYAVAMGIRLVCFGMLFVLDGWFKILAIIGAVFIPWFAVVIANGGSDTTNEHANALLDHAPHAELDAPETPAASTSATAAPDYHDVIPGEVIGDHTEADKAGDGVE